MVGGSLVMVILILVLVLVSVVGSGCDRIGSRSSTCGFGSFCLYGWFWVFFRSFSVFGLFSSSFPPLSPSFVYRPLSPFLLEFSFFIPWSHGVRFFWLSFRLFLVLLEEFFVRWKYRQLHVDSGQEGFGISCVVVLSFIPEGFMILSSSILDPLNFAIMVELCSLVIEVVFTEVSQIRRCYHMGSCQFETSSPDGGCLKGGMTLFFIG